MLGNFRTRCSAPTFTYEISNALFSIAPSRDQLYAFHLPKMCRIAKHVHVEQLSDVAMPVCGFVILDRSADEGQLFLDSCTLISGCFSSSHVADQITQRDSHVDRKPALAGSRCYHAAAQNTAEAQEGRNAPRQAESTYNSESVVQGLRDLATAFLYVERMGGGRVLVWSRRHQRVRPCRGLGGASKHKVTSDQDQAYFSKNG